MSRFISFTIGLVAGAYIAQQYKIPQVSIMIQTAVKKISEYEKKN